MVSGLGRYTQADPIGIGGAGMFDDGAFRRCPNILSLRPVVASDSHEQSREISPYTYGGANPLSLIDPRGLETLTCAVEALTRTPIKQHCLYGGLCRGQTTRRWFITLGLVNPLNTFCHTCSPFCSFRMLGGGDSMQWADDWRCYPPMPIQGQFSPNVEP